MEDIWEIMRARHSVRKYDNRAVEPEKAALLADEIGRINAESGLSFKLVIDEPEAFKADKPSYGSFSGCRNYVVLAGRKGDDEKVGYYGERLVLFAQKEGLNTCWVALTFEKSKVRPSLGPGEVLFDVLALGYGLTPGTPHRSKSPDKVAEIGESTPEWFKKGVEAALLAPTAINQQKFFFKMTDDGRVAAKAFLGPCSKTDLGIVKYHFELGAGRENFEWAE